MIAQRAVLSVPVATIAVLLLAGCGASGPDPDKVFGSTSDAEQYALRNYCKADTADRVFGSPETITCANGTKLAVDRVWDRDGKAAGYRLRVMS
jgi:hypothetical protein